jgi:hypothetical protein
MTAANWRRIRDEVLEAMEALGWAASGLLRYIRRAAPSPEHGKLVSISAGIDFQAE